MFGVSSFVTTEARGSDLVEAVLDRKQQRSTGLIRPPSGRIAPVTSGAQRPAGRTAELAAEARVRAGGLTLGMKFALLVAALIAVIVLFWGLVISNVMRGAMEAAIISKGAETARAVGLYAKKLLEGRSPGAPPAHELAQLAYIGGDQRSDLLDVVVRPAQGQPMTMRKTPFAFQPDATPEQLLGSSGVKVVRGMVVSDRGSRRAIRIESPIQGSSGFIGTVWVLIDAQRVEDSLTGLWSRMIAAGFVFLLVGVGAMFFLAGRVIRPVKMLIEDMERVSRGDYDHQTRAVSGDEIGMLALQFNKMTKALREAREKEKEAERLSHELDAAREIQATLLPPKIPQIAGFDTFPFYRSAKEVGGDYYDFFPVDRERLAIIVADVSGKGIPGSMVMAQTRTLLRMLAPECGSAAETLRRTNYLISREIKRGMFVTAFFTILNVRTKELTACSAGHNPMVIFRERTGQCELVNPSGIALGFDRGPVFDRTLQEVSVQLDMGDRIVLYTDGVVEAMNERHEEYGDERLYKFIAEHARMRSKDFVTALVRDLDAHKGEAEQHDDITIATTRVVPV